MTPAATYSPGPWLAVTGPTCWALLELDAADPRADAAQAAVTAAEPVDELLDVMISRGLRNLPGFAIAHQHTGGIRYVVRPPALVEIGLPGRTEQITEVVAGSWLDTVIDEAALRLVLSGAELDAPGDAVMPLDGAPATAAAGRVVVTLAVPPTEPPPTEPPSVDPIGNHTVDRRVLSARLEETPTGQAASPPGAPPSGPPGVSPDGPPPIIDGVPWAADRMTPTLTPPPPPRWAPPPAPPPGPAPHSAPPSARPPATGSVAASPTDLPPPDPTGAVPGPPPGSPPGPPPGPPPGSPEPPETGPSGTRKRADLLRELAQRPPGPAGPTVWAVTCPRGHLTPAYAAVCRVCAAALPDDQTPVEVPRPTLGRLVLSSGGAVALDRDAVFGRAPSSPIADPAQRPNLVRLTSSEEVSRRHVEVRLDGWQVLVRDLGSANGTMLTLPGGRVQQLRAQEDYPLEPGTVITLAEVVSITFEVPEQR